VAETIISKPSVVKPPIPVRSSPPLVNSGWVTAENNPPIESQGTEIIEEEEEEELDSRASADAKFFDQQIKTFE